MKTLVLTLGLLLATSTAARAQTSPPPSHRAAALELVEAANMEQALQASMDNMLRVQLEQNPALQQFEQVMRTFFARHLSWEVLKDGYAGLYADAFTEAELRQITAFYRSPVGQKMAAVTPQLMGRAAAMGENAVKANLPELQQMIVDQMQNGAAGGVRPDR